MIYSTPKEFQVRLHHCRPRFKNNRENVLLFMASEVCFIGRQTQKEFKSKLNSSIRLFPGNTTKSDKTINNWRTEITNLLGLVQYFEDGTCGPSKLAVKLSENQDLPEFFKYFCYYFQYPGGHLKPKSTIEMIQKGVLFKPASYILKVLKSGRDIADKDFGINKAEATHCIFNDLRVVRDNLDPKEVSLLIIKNRRQRLSYDSSGDVIRYAGDILDYMVLANLLIYRPNQRYYLNTVEFELIEKFEKNESAFEEYAKFYKQPNKLTLNEINLTQNKWFDYVNQISDDFFETDILSILDQSKLNLKDEGSNILYDFIADLKRKELKNINIKTKQIGDAGESISIHHEKLRLESIERPDLAKKVIKIPEAYAAGYDINSYEGVGEIKRCIEVKTTISKSKVNITRFHMTPNEWGAAETYRDAYYIYRLLISTDGVDLFVIRNPVQKYKNDQLSMVPRNGVDITYDNKSGEFEL